MTESRFRIFATSIPHGAGPQRPLDAAPVAELEPDLPIVVRDHVLDSVSLVLDSEPEPGESVQSGFDRKEHALRACFDRLDPDSRAATSLRLATGAPDDPIVGKLARLSTERRQRLISSLAEAPRRRAR